MSGWGPALIVALVVQSAPADLRVGLAASGNDGICIALSGAAVRICSASEGLHVTVWSGMPLRSARLWHQYWYLGYDVESDCQRADYEPR